MKAFIIVIMFLFSQTFASTESLELNSKNVAARMDAYLQAYAEAKDFSGVVLVAQGDEILFKKAYGFAEPDSKKPNLTNTAFRIASLSKTFTAAGIGILIEQNKVHLNDPLSQFDPDFPNGSNIKVEHLLLHSSGVGRLDGPEYSRNCFSISELVQQIAKIPAQFPPGSDGQYSNEGYVLLAAIIEKASGMSYEAFLRKNIWEPLGMKNTGVMCNQWPLANHSYGSIAVGDGTTRSLPFEQAGWDGPGSLYSNADDLLLWLKALNNDRPFHFSKQSYPYGWGKRDYSGHKLVEQTGMLEGYTAQISLYPEEKIYFVFLNNIQSGLFNRLPIDFESVVFGGTPSSPPPVAKPVAAKDLAEYQGAYLNEKIPVPLNIELKNDRLSIFWGEDVFRRPITMTGSDEFYLRAEYAQIKFERDKTGKIIQSSWFWGDSKPLVFKKRR